MSAHVQNIIREAGAKLAPPLSRPLELFICGNQNVARHAGFVEHGRHRQDHHLLAWWPEADVRRLIPFRFIRVVVDSSTHRQLYSERNHSLSGRYAEAVVQLRKGQQEYGANAIWIEF